jgi:hypothetical protein
MLGIAAVCLFAKSLRLQLWLILLFAIGFLGAWMSVSFLQVSQGFKGYWGPLADAFGVQAATVDWLLVAMSAYLLVGCLVSRLAASGRRPAGGTGESKTKAA